MHLLIHQADLGNRLLFFNRVPPHIVGCFIDLIQVDFGTNGAFAHAIHIIYEVCLLLEVVVWEFLLQSWHNDLVARSASLDFKTDNLPHAVRTEGLDVVERVVVRTVPVQVCDETRVH